jgi:hypothetical protein
MKPEGEWPLSKSHPVLPLLRHMYPAHIHSPQYFLILSYQYFHVLLYPSGTPTETFMCCHVLVTIDGVWIGNWIY